MNRRNKIELSVTIVSALAGLAGMLGAFWLLPYRMEQVEESVAALEQKVETANDDRHDLRILLTRIDERLKSIDESLKRGR
jgi:hypothetical protein